MNKKITVFLLVMLCCTMFSTPPSSLAGQTVQKETMLAEYPIDNTDFPVLYLNDPRLHGEAVWMLQARLKELGYELTVNGIYSPETCLMVRMFNNAEGLEDSSIVTRATWERLMNLSGDPSLSVFTDKPQENKKRLLIVIDIATRRLTLYENDKVVKEFPVAVGKSKTPSPLGEWKIVHKSLNWGNGFGTRWMGLNVPWGIYGIHGTNKPGSIGSYASHGCIRMFNQQVEELYPLVSVGTRVRIVEDGQIFPKNFTPQKLKKKDSGQKVVYVQSRLKELGFEFDHADGRFGNMTELAVKYFQIWHGLPVNGELNEETYRAMGMIE